jgi:hypothetical protein
MFEDHLVNDYNFIPKEFLLAFHYILFDINFSTKK